MTFNLRHLSAAAAIVALSFAAAGAAGAQDSMSSGQMSSMSGHTKMVGGAAMYPSRNIIQNAVNSKDHTTLVAAVKEADLVDTLSGPGPFTVFAPTNEAFAKLPSAAVQSLMQPENKPALIKVLTYHVVSGRLTAADLMAQIKAGGGTATLTTVEGEPLMASLSGRHVVLTDAKGGKSRVTIADVMQSNGVIHVVDTVLMP